MPSLRFLAVVGLLMLGMKVGLANLGETEAQCMARYGGESNVQEGLGYHQIGDRAAYFHAKAGDVSLVIRVVFLNGKACREHIANADVARGLTERQMKALLDADAAGQKWHRQRRLFRTDSGWDTSGIEDWERSDGALARLYLSGKAASRDPTGEMDLSTRQYAAAQAYYDQLDGNN